MTLKITITGPQGSGKTTIAAAIREMLMEGDFPDVSVVSPEEPDEVDKAIENLHYLRPKPRVEIAVKTVNVPASTKPVCKFCGRGVGFGHDMCGPCSDIP